MNSKTRIAKVAKKSAPSFSEEFIREHVDYRIPESICRHIKNRRQIAAINKAAIDIDRFTGRRRTTEAIFYFLEFRYYTKLVPTFVKNPQKFVRAFRDIYRTFKDDVGKSVIYTLNSKRFRVPFSQNPQKVVNELKAVARKSRGAEKWILLAISQKSLSELYDKKPKLLLDAFRKLAEYTGKARDAAIGAIIHNRHLTSYFVKNPKKVVDEFKTIAEATNKSPLAFASVFGHVWSTLRYIKNPKRGIDAFRELPKIYEQTPAAFWSGSVDRAETFSDRFNSFMLKGEAKRTKR